MKSVKQFVYALLLVSALAANTYAGDLETPGFVPPPPPQNSMRSVYTESASDNPEIVVAGDTIETSDQLFYDALMAMLSVF